MTPISSLNLKRRPSDGGGGGGRSPSDGGAGGALGLAKAEATRGRLATESLPNGEAQSLLDSGKTARTLGYAGLGVGVAALGTAVVVVDVGHPMAVVEADKLDSK